MKKHYTRKQIQEAISYWKGKLRRMNEENEMNEASGGIKTVCFVFNTTGTGTSFETIAIPVNANSMSLALRQIVKISNEFGLKQCIGYQVMKTSLSNQEIKNYTSKIGDLLDGEDIDEGMFGTEYIKSVFAKLNLNEAAETMSNSEFLKAYGISDADFDYCDQYLPY